MKAKLVKESLSNRNRMSVEEFVEWFNDLLNRYDEIDRYDVRFMISVLMNDEVNTDEELRSYLLDEIDEFKEGKMKRNYTQFVDELLDKRDYFMDFTYAQDFKGFLKIFF